ncbi:hypothetical protein Tco_0823134 [Tanacetum coccineum]|uniref:Uncharacterized protein n=1 Tax=Tanacetum coccineum TaxID=301880 RepID=A0ABQ5AH34_9ASTR
MAMKQRKRKNNLMNWKWDAVIVIEDSDDEVHGRTNVQPRGAREPPWKISPFTSAISAGLQTKLLRHTRIVSLGLIFDDALSVFNTSMETDLLSNATCSRVFAGDIYGDHVVSCAGIIGIKHRHNVVHDTLVDICYRSGISAGRAVIDAAQRKRGKYMAKCAAIGYGFLPFSFSSLGELEADAVTLLKRIR